MEADAGRYFYVIPEFVSAFDNNNVCTLCGGVCKHELYGVHLDAVSGEYVFACKDKCYKAIDLDGIPFEQESSFTSARANYDALSDEQKALVRVSEYYKLEKHEAIMAEITLAQDAMTAARRHDCL